MIDVVIIGSGHAGLTAARYTARAGLKTFVIEGCLPGGQLMNTTVVENFPGFPRGILGPDLINNMRAQAVEFGAKFVYGDAMAVDFSHRPFKVWVAAEAYEARVVIVATGASPKLLGVPNESRLMGKGVSTCATCDGAFFKGKKVAVIGGGDSALEEAIFLTRFADTVTIIHRRNALRASQIMQQRAMATERLSVLWNTVVEDVLGENTVTELRVRNVVTGNVDELPFDGVFIAIGHVPNTKLFEGQLEIDADGYIVAHERTKTSVPGVFVAGDVQDHLYRQAITAAGSGCMAAMDCAKWLESN